MKLSIHIFETLTSLTLFITMGGNFFVTPSKLHEKIHYSEVAYAEHCIHNLT